MVDLKLENDEGIIQQANSVEMYKANDVYEEIYEMYLTNKNIIYYYEKSNGLFAKSEEIIEKIPLQNIRIVNDKLQISKVDNDEYGLGLQIILQNGERVHFVFDKKKELQIWYDVILETITGEKSESNTTSNNTTKKENAVVSSFLGVVQTVKDIANDQINDVKDMFIDDEEVDTTSNNKVEVKQEKLENNNLSNNKEEKAKESMDSKEKKSMYCRNCGEKLVTNSKFCNYCGTPTETSENDENEVEEKKIETKKEELTERKMVYEGKIHKCPNCGEVLNSFVTNCPACGYELRNINSVESLKDLSYRLSRLNDERQKELLIKNFPIPNTKEDIIEFLIIAKTNLENNSIDSNKLISEAWKVKLEQVYQKSKMLFNNTEQLNDIEKMYFEAKKCITKKKVTNSILTNIVFFIGIIIMLVAIIIDKTGGNSSMVELISCIVIIAGTATLNKRNADTLDYCIGGIIGFGMLIVSKLFNNGSLVLLSGGIVLIIVAINYFKSLTKK